MGHPADGNFWGYDNYWENAGYLGVWALLMAGFAISNLKHLHSHTGASVQISNLKWVVRFFAVAACVSLFFALGRFLPFFPVLYKAVPV